MENIRRKLEVRSRAQIATWVWRPVARTIWSVSGPSTDAPRAGYAAGWALTVSATFAISHTDLFGLQQAWLHARHLRNDSKQAT